MVKQRMQRTAKRINRLLAAAMAVFLWNGGLPVPALLAEEAPSGEEAARETLSISTAEELAAFSKSCTIDGYSRGLRVLLIADIDLTGTSFSPVPVFCGEFDGGGHRISGFSYTHGGSDQGFFRYLRPEASIRNLTLEGVSLEPAGSKSGVGGLVGRNEGLIVECFVEGKVSGETDVGGLAGVNEKTGVLRGCANLASVSGSKHTGGIAGRNFGTVENCTNRGGVNIGANEKSTDTGGIIGCNEGMIIGCGNLGDVGYPHTGYNTGGVSGIQRGGISYCRNNGVIQGRKDVGGIAGQFEPDITEILGVDPVERLDGDLSTLTGLLQQLSNQIDSTVGNASDRLKTVNDAVTSIRDTIKGGENGSPTLSATLDDLYTAAQSLRDAGDGVISGFRAAGRSLSSALEDLSDALAALRNLNLPDIAPETEAAAAALEAVRADLDALGGSLAKMEPLTAAISDALADRTLTQEEIAHVKEIAASLGETGILKAAGQLMKDVALLAEKTAALQKKLSSLTGSAASSTAAALAQLGDAGKRLGRASDLLGDVMDTEWKDFNQSLRDMGDTADLYWKPTPDTNRVAEIGEQLDVIGEQVDGFADGAETASGDLRGTTSAVIDQLDRIRKSLNEFADMPEKTIDDVSDEEAAEPAEGMVSSCKNRGSVRADSNAGGIVGTISVELSLDPEDNLDFGGDDGKGRLLADSTTLIKATIYDCQNSAEVAAKNACGGGILGLGELGAVLRCVNTGNIEVTDGSYCGGVAGRSLTVVRDSHSIALLTGTDYVGGIAGEGNDLYGCYSMTGITGDGECRGAIAGQAKGVVDGNYFVREELAGIDGVDYEGRAVPLSYQEFAGLMDLPEVFRSFTVTFRADGRTVKMVSVPYGGAFPVSELPVPPEKDGYDAAWEDFDQSAVRRSLTVEAVYTPWASTVSSGGTQPLLLAEGAFMVGTVLNVREWVPETVPEGYRLISSFTFTVESGGREKDVPMTVRIRSGAVGESVRVAIWNNGEMTLIQPERDGSYLLVPMEASGQIAVLERPVSVVLWASIGAGCLLLAALAVFLLLRGRKKKQTAFHK